MAKKTIVFYSGSENAKAARDLHKEEHDTYQIIEAESYNGERLEADAYEFAGDVPAAQQQRIKDIWGKFDNRQNMEKSGGPTSLGGVERTPAADRRNLNPETRVDDPKKVKENQVEKRPGFAPPAGANADHSAREDHKGVGLDATTGFQSKDRNKIPRSDDK